MKAIILAAGQGKRMRSNIQKLLHPILGKTIIQYVIETVQATGIEDVTVVIGSDGAEIVATLGSIYPQLHFAIQESALGTAHAVQAGTKQINDNDDVLILYGSMPLVTEELIKKLNVLYEENHIDGVVTASSPHIFKGRVLKQGLAKMRKFNDQSEYDLADLPQTLREDGYNIQAYKSLDDMTVFTGINTQVQLAEAVQHMRNRINTKHMLNGVRMIDPSTVYIDDTVEIKPGVIIYPNVILEGVCKIDGNVIIGPNSHLKNTTVGTAAHINQSVLHDSKIGAGTTVGPFAYLRQNANVGCKCRIGNFVEIKNSNIGDGTKAAHLTYIGDADVGKKVNFGCGAITVNYVGKNKHHTIIEDHAFIGSNSNLVAPVKVGEGAYTAAGSTITNDLQSCSLGIARARQVEKLNWTKTKKT